MKALCLPPGVSGAGGVASSKPPLWLIRRCPRWEFRTDKSRKRPLEECSAKSQLLNYLHFASRWEGFPRPSSVFMTLDPAADSRHNVDMTRQPPPPARPPSRRGFGPCGILQGPDTTLTRPQLSDGPASSPPQTHSCFLTHNSARLLPDVFICNRIDQLAQ